MAIVNAGIELALKTIRPPEGARKVYGVFATTPGFEIEGKMEFHSRPDLRTLMVTDAERSLLILNAQAVMTGRLGSRFAGELIFINCDFTGLFSLSGEAA
ncbi:MAG: hypothetical protein J7452_02720 [Thermoflexus sp.]|jgi:hypothetical protein|nr:hypothetical protein [Thermoflexus sp.]